MTTVILVIHLMLAIALVGMILIQRSEGGGLGIGGGGSGGGMGGFMTGRSAANLLTRTTAGLATGFIITSLTLAILAGNQTGPSSILDGGEEAAPATEAAPVEPAPAEEKAPTGPSVPLSK